MILLEYIYKLITRIRNYLYDKNIIKSYSSKYYTISIGNIIVGGTGKTPLIIYIANMLKSAGFRIGIVAGGYKRKSKGSVIVHSDESLLANVQEAGDEAYLLATKLQVPVVIHNKKYLALKELDRLYNIDVVLIDDGFQHRKIKRDLDIVIINNKTVEEEHLIPKGYLREEKHNIRRATTLIYRDLGTEIEGFKSISSFHIKSSIIAENVDSDRAIVITSIANPANFVNFLEQNTATIEKTFAFKDHHYFKRQEIVNILDYCKQNKIKKAYITEKDYVKIKEFENLFKKISTELMCIELEIKFQDKLDFEKYIIEKIK